MHLLFKFTMNWKNIREEPAYTDSTISFAETVLINLTNFLHDVLKNRIFSGRKHSTREGAIAVARGTEISNLCAHSNGKTYIFENYYFCKDRKRKSHC